MKILCEMFMALAVANNGNPCVDSAISENREVPVVAAQKGHRTLQNVSCQEETCVGAWKYPPLCFSVDEDTRDLTAVMKLGRGRRSGRTGTPGEGVLLLRRGHFEVIL